MKKPASRHRTATRWRVLVLVVMAAAVLAGCDLATGTVRTATELEKAGIDNPNLDYDGGTARLNYNADSNPLEARTEQDTAARIIWENLPFRIERIVITSDGGAFPTRREYPRSTLEEVLGPRPADLDRSVEDIAQRAAWIAGIVGFVVLALIVLVIVLVVRAVRRHPAAQPAGWPQGQTGPQPWGQPGSPGQPGWGQPAPPGSQVPPEQQPWGGQPGYGQPGYGQPPSPVWPQPPAPPQPPPAPAPQPPGPAGAGADWPAGEPRPQGAPGAQGAPGHEGTPPPRGPGDTQRLEPEPPADDQGGPTPPVPPG